MSRVKPTMIQSTAVTGRSIAAQAPNRRQERGQRRGQPFRAQVAVAALIVAGPLTFSALKWGHPEELLAAALCVGGAIAAVRGRVLVGGLLLGLALATKEWAWLALLPVAIAMGPG